MQTDNLHSIFMFGTLVEDRNRSKDDEHIIVSESVQSALSVRSLKLLVYFADFS